MSLPHLVIHTDGGARGNPGPAGIGAVLEASGQIIKQISDTIGRATNNQAEYQAVVAALEAARALEAEEVDIYADSELIVKQLRREYKVKHPELAPLFMKVQSLLPYFKRVDFHVISREDNQLADVLVNRALDAQVLSE